MLLFFDLDQRFIISLKTLQIEYG